MTSVLAKQAELKPNTKFVIVNTPSYYENNTSCYIPIPFTVKNGVLDINNWSSSVDDLISNGDYNEDAETQVKVMGGLSKVFSLGANMITYLENMVQNYEEDSFTPNIKLVIAPVMTRIQTSADTYYYDQPLYTYESINFHPSEPSGDGYIFEGNSTNDYLGSWIFKTALTISYEYDGNTKYTTLTTSFHTNETTYYH